MDLTWLSLRDANTQWVLAGSMLLGLSSGVLGALALLRRRSLMGDALAHAALPGIALAYLLVGAKHTGAFMVGAAVAGVLGTLCIAAITRYSRIKEDTALGLVLTVFFGFGIMLLTHIQKTPRGNQSGLDKFLFGQAASLVGADVQVMAAVAAALCLVTLLLFKEFKLLCFDSGFGRGLGFPMGLLDLLLMGMIVMAVVIGLQAVGVVLMAAMLITPAAAARYWTERLDRMVMLSGLFGAAAGALGTLVSQAGARLPTGPLIVLAATAVFVVSLLLAPQRGLLAAALRFLRLRARLQIEAAARALYELAEAAGDPGAAFTAAQVAARGGHAGALPALVRAGWAGAAGGRWALTPAGLARAYGLVRRRRMWELLLMHESDLGGAPVDREADDLAAAVPAPVAQELERLLRLHGLEPRLQPMAAGGEEGV